MTPLVRCPGCGGRNPREAISCEWCYRPFLQVPSRGLSARWWGVASGLVVVVLLVLIGALAFLNTTRSTGRASDAQPVTPSSPPPTASPSAAASDSSLPAAATTTATQSEAPVPPTPPTEARSARIANTDGRGANLRREPNSASSLVTAAAENSTVRLLGPEQRGGDGRLWQQVEDTRGNQGWIPADLLLETR